MTTATAKTRCMILHSCAQAIVMARIIIVCKCRKLKNMCSVQAFLDPNDPNNEGHVAFELDGQEDNEEDEDMEDDGDDGDAGGI